MVVVTTAVPAGAVITSADVGTTTIAAGPGVHDIPARQLCQVMGLVAATSLRPGTLLAPSELTSKLPPAPGQELVPVAVKPSGLPASGLAPGDQVLVVATPAAGGEHRVRGGAGAHPAGAGRRRGGEHRSPTRTASTSSTCWSRPAPGPTVAEQAATGQIALIVTSRTAP